MSRAAESLLDGLHGLVAETLLEQIREARKPDENGKPGVVPPQLLDKALKFLKDNGIDAPARKSMAVGTLADELADLDLDEVAIGHA